MQVLSVWLFGAALFYAAAALSDTTLEYRVSTGETETITVTDGKVRIESKSKGVSEVIMLFDAAKKQIYVLSPRDRGYMVLDEQTLARQRQQMRQMMEQQMRGMSPEERRAMEQMLAQMQGAQAPPRPAQRFEKTAKSRRVAGVKCRIVIEYTGGKKTGELCVADPDALDMAAAEYRTMQAMVDLLARMAAQAPAPGAGAHVLVADIRGVPVRVADTGDGTTEVRELVAVRHARLPARLFEIPAGYKRIDIPGMTGM